MAQEFTTPAGPSGPGPVQEFPAPTPVPPKRNNTVWIIVAVVVVLLCCCCIAAALAWQYGDTFLNNFNFEVPRSLIPAALSFI